MAVRPRIVEEPGREYPVAILVDLGVPRDGRSVVGGDSEIQSAVTGTETSEPRHRQHAFDSSQWRLPPPS